MNALPRRKIRFAAACLAVALTLPGAASARDQVRIVGSSTVFPFTATVAEHFAKSQSASRPVVESTGSGGGFKLFCAGLGDTTPDIAAASRRIGPRELENCAANSVTEIAEIFIGYDGIVLAGARPAPPPSLSRDQLFRAIAKTVPVGGKLVPNPYRRWKDIDPALPDREIMIFGPAPNHGTRDTLVALVMDKACAKSPEIRALAPEARRRACQAVREDGAFIEVTESYQIAVKKLLLEPRAMAILPFSYMEQNLDRLDAATLDGQAATFDNILSGAYPLSRPLFLYVKKARLPVTLGLRQYLDEFTAERAWGPGGYLADKGLVPLPDTVRRAEAAKARELPNLVP